MSGTTYYYVTDGLGNVTAIYDHENENQVGGYEYDAFGNITYQSPMAGNPYGFTGREYDEETGLYYNNERYYDPEVGRFTSQDPLENEPKNCNGSCDSPAPQPDDEEQHHSPPIQEGTGDNLYAYAGNNPINRVDPLGLFWSSVRDATYPDGDGVSCTTCASSKIGGCGSAAAIGNPPTGHALCLYKVYGSASCDLSKPVSEPHDMDNNNDTCTSKCTDDHEKEHDENMRDCCDKARQAWQDAATEQIGVYRGRGLGQKTLAKKIRNIDKDRKVRAARRRILNQYNNYVNGARAWTECNAYKVSVQCANDLWDDYNCDCPKPEDKKCCRDIERYRKNAERQRDRNCKKKGADKPPDCPFD
jgi:RHS repeat-associated protein